MSAQIALKNLKNSIFVNGKYAAVENFIPVISGATGKEFAQGPACSVSQVDEAVRAATEAFKTWGKLSGNDRSEWLTKFADELEKRKQDFVSVEALNTSKPLREAEGDVDDAIGAFRYCSRRAATLVCPQPAEDLPDPNFKGSIQYVPVGVVAGICPWNFPLMMAAWKIAPALAAGCTAVIKPSEFTPFTTLLLGEVAEAINLPPGVLNIVAGAGPVGAALTEHPLVDKVTFTGSVPTGSRVMKSASDSIKRVTLELGGKSPVIVFPDAKLENAIEWIYFGFAWNCGQICSATTRLIVHKSIEKEVVGKLVQAAERTTFGGPFDEKLQGPICNAMQYKKVQEFLEIAKQEGLVPVTGGGKPANLPAENADGFFVAPTIFTGVTNQHTLFREEVFGPVLVVSTFETEEEALALANDSQYGLASAVFSEDLEKARRVASEINAGVVWINCAQPSPHAQPWGGFKKSGIGREMGPLALTPFLEMRAITEWNSETKLGWYPEEQFTF